MVTSPQVGAYFVTRTEGWGAVLIRWGTRSPVNHAGIYIGDGRIVEAEPSGAQISSITGYPNAVWSPPPVDGPAVAACALQLVGTPYSWVDVACIGITRLFGIHVPEAVRVRLRRRDRLMCSQLVDTAYLNAGIHLFNDGRISGDVSPGDLYHALPKR